MGREAWAHTRPSCTQHGTAALQPLVTYTTDASRRGSHFCASPVVLGCERVWDVRRQDRDSRRILLYIAVSFVCMIAELLYGMSVSSLGAYPSACASLAACVMLGRTRLTRLGGVCACA